MAKAIPRISSRRNGRIGSRKSARRIPKGVIHVQASLNKTIVTVTDERGRVVSWSSAVACCRSFLALLITYIGLTFFSLIGIDSMIE
jgi:hypothetical protein